MLSLSEWERNNFPGTSSAPDLTVIFPSREIYFSSALMSTLHLTSETCPRTLDQWYELCHPEDHLQTASLERALSGTDTSLSLTRRLYCGDGVYRSFRLDAYITRDNKDRPARLIGTETSPLLAWLALAENGDRIECTSPSGGVRLLEVMSIDGVKILQDVGIIEDMMRENITLRREIQRRVFRSEGLPVYHITESDSRLRNVLDNTLRMSLNVLAGSNALKVLRRSLSEECLTVGICGLSGSGKTSLMNALIGEKLIPSHARDNLSVLITCREGESRGAKIHYQDGRTEALNSRELTSSSLNEVLDKPGISRIDITIPGALIPEGICFIDTPGYDSLGGTNSSALRNILPELDAVLYVTPIRSGLKRSDYDYLRSIYALNDRVIFLMSHTDLETDDSEAGRVLLTASAKIAANIDALHEGLRTFTNEAVIVPVSYRQALEHFYDRESPEWTNSNLEALTRYLADDSSPFTRAIVLRADRTLRVLDEVLGGNALTGSSRWRLQDYAGTLRKALAQSADLAGPRRAPALIHTHHHPQTEQKNLLDSLITSLREHGFRTQFFSLKAFHGERNAVLLGADKLQSLRLYSRLAHNLLSERLPEGRASHSEWLCSGNAAPFECIRLPVISPGENVLIAPNDEDLTCIDWPEMFKHFTPVVSVDISRIVSGLNDLSVAPYLMGLAMSDWVLAFGNAGLFASRQTELMSSVPERVREFAEAGGLRMPEIFIYENYRVY